ncbi:hypothetical protein AAFF_G00008550 [Aldrovandia affinis]|uniref:Uncharacterized protein n=1 Tax=Aldrovandia affinis TaxID=143900 RepID=A0AAD7T699_9TELE|nr:hypothetical protein AAFF_G00008550 [Aldrovandia affinis]
MRGREAADRQSGPGSPSHASHRRAPAAVAIGGHGGAGMRGESTGDPDAGTSALRSRLRSAAARTRDTRPSSRQDVCHSSRPELPTSQSEYVHACHTRVRVTTELLPRRAEATVRPGGRSQSPFALRSGGVFQNRRSRAPSLARTPYALRAPQLERCCSAAGWDRSPRRQTHGFWEIEANACMGVSHGGGFRKAFWNIPEPNPFSTPPPDDRYLPEAARPPRFITGTAPHRPGPSSSGPGISDSHAVYFLPSPAAIAPEHAVHSPSAS